MKDIRNITGSIGAGIILIWGGYIALFISAWSGIEEALPLIVFISVILVLVIMQNREVFRHASVLLICTIIGIYFYLDFTIELSIVDIFDDQIAGYIFVGLLLCLSSGIVGLVKNVAQDRKKI